jgi:two-component system chemotaxis response regulator CheY
MIPAKVLVVDDSPIMRQFVVFALQRLPHLQIEEAGDGIEALKRLSSGDFDLLLSDIHMPLIDGMKLLSLIRKDPACSRLPVIIITTEGSNMTRERALDLGANAYLTKPLQTAVLVDTVRQLLAAESGSA